MIGSISEIFGSIQGEGIYLGQPQVFVRFFGCNLKCSFCDTNLSFSKEYTPEGLLKELIRFKGDYKTVSFTGGEPLLQSNFLREVLPLSRREGFSNYLETNGTLPEALDQVIDFVDTVAMDFKLPSSAATNDFWGKHREFLRIASEKEVFVKAVVGENTNEDDMSKTVRAIKETSPGVILVLQPDSSVSELSISENMEKFRVICRNNGVTACVIPQVHKLVGVK